MKKFLLPALLLAALALTWTTAFAQDPTPARREVSDDEVNAIARQLYCPVCENTPLDVCPTEACRQWRDEIRQMLAQGRTEAEIKQHFVDYYGQRVLGEPPRQGWNWLVYLVPPALIALGAGALALAFRRWIKPVAREQAAGGGDAQTNAGDEYQARLEAELRRRR